VTRRGCAARSAAFVLGLALAGTAGLAAHAGSSDEVSFARATALARAGRCPEALAVLSELATPTARSVNLRAQCQLDAKDWPAALASLEEAKRLDPAVPGVALHLAVARFHMGDYEGSREALDQAAPSAQDDPQYHLYRGLVLLQAARSAEAARELARARTLGPGAVEPGASYYEGLAWAGAEEGEKARESLDRVIESAPGSSWALEAERAKADLSRLAGARGRVWAFARAGLEYDTNVQLRGEELFPSQDSSDDMRGAWLLHGGRQLIGGRGWAAGVQATYYGTAQFDLSAFDEQ
jgi:tetratricopeptide (TPR) repeat protein